jgi:tetratricopeptide (TPR) repeat protein
VRDQSPAGKPALLTLTKPLGQLKIPPTVQAILAARIDRLDLATKDLLQTLAVIGKEFPLALARRVVSTSDGELNRMLSDLQLGEFIYEQPAAGDIEFMFKHALTLEVAYNSVLTDRRRALHERTAAAIESLFSDHLNDHLSELAHQYSRSRNTRKAVEYLRRAGDQALQRSAHAEAVSFLNEGLELLKELTDDAERTRNELSLQVSLGQCLAIIVAPTSAEVERAYLRALELCRGPADDVQLFSALSGLRLLYFFRGDLPRSRELAEKLLALAERTQDPVMLADANHAMGNILALAGELAAARERFERVIALPQSSRPRHNLGVVEPRVGSFCQTALLLWQLGYPEQSLRTSAEAIVEAKRLSEPYTLMVAFFVISSLRRMIGDWQGALDHVEAAEALATQYGFSGILPVLSFRRGSVLAAQGIEKGIALMREGIPDMANVPFGRTDYFLVDMADGYLRTRRAKEGLEVVNEALARTQETGVRQSRAGLCRLKGELLLLGSGSEQREAEGWFREAIEVAQGQSAKSWELRATMSFARLLAKQDKRDEGKKVLAEIYGWFTEGFDTADLKDAKALVEEFSR